MTSSRERSVTALFAVTSFVTAALIFLVEPLVGKLILPSYGGSVSVWNVCMVFFQIALLLGYAYAHASWHRLQGRQLFLHAPLIALPLVMLPLGLPQWTAPPEGVWVPAWISLVLMVMVAAPFVALATSAPLLQAWFSSTTHSRAGDPYFLYATGNAGSFVGLLSYPLLVEPLLTLTQQRRWWSVAYGVAVTLLITCAWVARRHGRAALAERGSLPVHQEKAASTDRLTLRRRVMWVLLAALPSSLLLGVTTYITTDVGAAPLLWVLPLAIYLLTFVVSFGRPSRPSQQVTTPAMLALLLAVVFVAGLLDLQGDLPRGVGHLSLFAVMALAVHRKLAADRPGPGNLTQFFLFVALGGVLGGAFNSLLAPVLFSNAVEYFLVIAVTIVLLAPEESSIVRPARWPGYVGVCVPALIVLSLGGIPRTAIIGVVSVLLVALTAAFAAMVPRAAASVVAVLLIALSSLMLSASSDRSRSFYGVYLVDRQPEQVSLWHGTTLHGGQYTNPLRKLEPTSYYAPGTPFSDAMRALRNIAPVNDWAIIGLGAGVGLSYVQAGDTVTVYEIDQLDVDIASNPENFTFLSAAKGRVRVEVGDGRLKLQEAPDHGYRAIVLDAFSSDAIPTHLLTREAMALYRLKLAPDGLLIFNITNRNLDLNPVVSGLAQDAGLSVIGRRYQPATKEALITRSEWVVLARSSRDLDYLRSLHPGWQSPPQEDRVTWTDDYTNITSLIRWLR